MKMIGMRLIRRAKVAASKNQQPVSGAADPRERTSGRVALCAPSSSTCISVPVSLTQVPAPSKAIAADLAAIAIAAPSIGNQENAVTFGDRAAALGASDYRLAVQAHPQNCPRNP